MCIRVQPKVSLSVGWTGAGGKVLVNVFKLCKAQVQHHEFQHSLLSRREAELYTDYGVVMGGRCQESCKTT